LLAVSKPVARRYLVTVQLADIYHCKALFVINSN
jgi:hypothetical protein